MHRARAVLIIVWTQAAGTETPESAEVAQQRLQDKYDITKQISLDVVLHLVWIS